MEVSAIPNPTLGLLEFALVTTIKVVLLGQASERVSGWRSESRGINYVWWWWWCVCVCVRVCVCVYESYQLQRI
jgi:hypothetical protein